MSSKAELTKDTIEFYLKELGKVFKKKNGTKTPAEIILIGGGSILINYGFRNSTTDLDAIIHASSAMKESINEIGDKYNLPNGWLNTDFVKTTSYSTKLIEHSKYYRTFSNVLQVRTVSSEYLIAMKLLSAREYKHDLSDIVGIILEENKHEDTLSLETIQKAFIELYGNEKQMPENSKLILEECFNTKDLKTYYSLMKERESQNKNTLIELQEEYPGILKSDTVENILKKAKKKL